jgi:hypothetical protein
MANPNRREIYHHKSVGDYIVMLAGMTLVELRRMDLERAARAWKLPMEWMREYHRREVEFKSQ